MYKWLSGLRANWWKDKVTMFEWLSGKSEWMKGLSDNVCMIEWKEWMDETIKWQCLNDWVERVNGWKDKVTMFEWLSGTSEWMKG